MSYVVITQSTRFTKIIIARRKSMLYIILLTIALKFLQKSLFL